MPARVKLALGGGLVAVALFAFSVGTLFAQTSPATPTHEQMHQMMDAMHGEGFSERMREAMPGSEEMMDQCVAMMGMMQHTGGMGGMMGGSGPMRGMMDRMMAGR